MDFSLSKKKTVYTFYFHFYDQSLFMLGVLSSLNSLSLAFLKICWHGEFSLKKFVHNNFSARGDSVVVQLSAAPHTRRHRGPSHSRYGNRGKIISNQVFNLGD